MAPKLNPVLSSPSTVLERKSKMGAAVIEGKHLPIIIDDEQRTASAAND
jgi:hypothetical protein